MLIPLFVLSGYLAHPTTCFSSLKHASHVRKELFKNRERSLGMIKWENILPIKNQEPNSSTLAKNRDSGQPKIVVGPCVGSGSYGTVHFCKYVIDHDCPESNQSTNKEQTLMICKRSWRKDEITGFVNSVDDPTQFGSNSGDIRSDDRPATTKARRCQHFLQVERHCFEKLQSLKWPSGQPQIPEFKGLCKDSTNEEIEWLVFELISRGKHKQKDGSGFPQPAATLADAMYTDWKKQHAEINNSIDSHHLDVVQQELGLPSDASFADTLDAVFSSLLSAVAQIHDANIVHRDLKPANILLDRKRKVRSLYVLALMMSRPLFHLLIQTNCLSL